MGTENLQEKSFVSIIIPTWRDEKILNRCLDSLLTQDYPQDKYEIILVSKAKLDIQNDMIKIIYNVDYGQSRNEAAKIARGSILAFVDDDCIMPKDWLAKGVKYFSDEKVAIVGGPALPFEKDDLRHRLGGYLLASPLVTGFASCRYRLLPNSYEAEEYSLLTANNFVRKNIFEAISGFDPSQVAAEENDLYFRIKKIGYKLLYAPEIFVWHRAKPIVWSLISKIFFYATGRGILIARKPQTIRFIYLVPSFFVLSLLAFLFLSIYSGLFFYFLLGTLFSYFIWTVINAFYIFFNFEKTVLVILSLPLSFLVHVSYGLGFLFGVLKYLLAGRSQ